MDHAQFLSRTDLFSGSTAEEVSLMLECLGAHSKRYRSGEHVLHMGGMADEIGMVLSGGVRVESVDAWGNVSILGEREPGSLFGEAHAVVPDAPLMVNVVALAEPTEILFLTLSKVTTTCPRACPFHARTIVNMARVIARHNLELSQRIFHMAPKTIRGKVLSYLSDHAEHAGSREFDIPFNRQQLADYLGVDRSALSAELSRMRRDGLLATHRSHFVLHA